MTKETLMKFATAAVLSAIALAPVQAFELKDDVIVKPGHGMSINVGAKKAITYFTKNAGQCDVTIMLSEQNPVIGNSYQFASKVKIQLVPGNSTLVESANGKSVKVRCNRDANTMTIQNPKVELSALTQ